MRLDRARIVGEGLAVVEAAGALVVGSVAVAAAAATTVTVAVTVVVVVASVVVVVAVAVAVVAGVEEAAADTSTVASSGYRRTATDLH